MPRPTSPPPHPSARPIAKRDLPELQSGPARITVTAERTALFGMRRLEARATRDVLVRLEPPRVGILSMHHFINHGRVTTNHEMREVLQMKDISKVFANNSSPNCSPPSPIKQCAGAQLSAFSL